MTAIPIKKNPSISFKYLLSQCQFATPNSIINLIIKIVIIKIADINPNLPIWLAIASNFSYNGVASTSSDLKILEILPSQLSSPVIKIIILPVPYTILVPDINIGDGTSCGFALCFYYSATIWSLFC